MTTATFDRTLWLRRLCLPEDYAGPHGWAREPHWVHYDCGWWTVATDKRLLVAVAGNWLGESPQSTAGAVAPLALRYFDALPHVDDVLPLDLLRSWCGPAQWVEPCPSCKGSAKESPHVVCTFCESEGVVSPDPRPAPLVAGVHFDRELLARALEGLGEGEAAYCLESSKAMEKSSVLPVLRMESLDRLPHGQPAWRLALMPMTLNEHSPQPGPPLGAGLLSPGVLAWGGGVAVRLAAEIVEGKRWSELPVLADALADAGADAELCDHLRRPHARACWLAEAIAKEERND